MIIKNQKQRKPYITFVNKQFRILTRTVLGNNKTTLQVLRTKILLLHLSTKR